MLNSIIRKALTNRLVMVGLLLTSAIAVAQQPTTTLLPVVDGDEATRSAPFIAWIEDLTQQSYVEEEYSVAGKANIYTYLDDANQSPEVGVLEADVPYVTRILVRRPDCGKKNHSKKKSYRHQGKHRKHCRKFNGTVYVEVLNATAGWDGDPIWQSNSEHLIRDGAAWVGISTKPVVVDFLRDTWGQAPFPVRNTQRYADLTMPHFGQVWDMLSQIGGLLKQPKTKANPLKGFDVERLILVGYSQSAGYQVTYANSFHHRATTAHGAPVYDGYFISAGGTSAKHVTGPTDSTPESLERGDARNLTVVDAPVIRFQTQTEVVRFPSYPVRQSEEEYPQLRFYEMAGGAHVDSHLNSIGGQALVRDLGLPPTFCPDPSLEFNPIRIGYVQSALLEALERWIAWGIEPPASRFIALNDDAGTISVATDADGNAIGGIRPPQITAPLGRYVETNEGPGFCSLFGGFEPFGTERLEELYPRRYTYFHKLNRAIWRAKRDGFLLGPDARALRREALQNLHK